MAGNHNSGRRPKPTALKVLQGNPGKRPLNQAEPKPPSGEVVMPGELSQAGRVVWGRLSPIARAMGTLTTADVEAFKTLCELQASLDMAARMKDSPEFAVVTVSDDGAVMAAHPVFSLELKYAPVIRPYYERFGLEPAGRSRIQLPEKAPTSKWAGML